VKKRAVRPAKKQAPSKKARTSARRKK
jgi:hypothetical protein